MRGGRKCRFEGTNISFPVIALSWSLTECSGVYEIVVNFVSKETVKGLNLGVIS